MNFLKSLVLVLSALFLCASSETSCFTAKDALDFVQTDKLYAFIVGLLIVNHVNDLLDDVVKEPRHQALLAVPAVAGLTTIFCAAVLHPGKATIALGAFYALRFGSFLWKETLDAYEECQDYRKENTCLAAEVHVSE